MHAAREVDLQLPTPTGRSRETPRSLLNSARKMVAGPKARATFGLVFLVAIVVLFALPSSFGLGIAGSHAVPSAPMERASTAASIAKTYSAPPSMIPSSEATLPGSNPSILPYANTPVIDNSILSAQAAHPENWTLLAHEVETGTVPTIGTTPAAAPHPDSSYVCPTGSVVGTILNGTQVPLEGVTVEAYSATGAASCPLNQIPPVTTNASGGFDVKGPVGADYLTFSIGWYLNNITYVQIYTGTTTYLPATIYMVKDAILTGTVEGNNSRHSTLSGVTVSAVARDQSQICDPTGSTSSNGKFTVALCPLPSIITFTPPYGYLSTFRYENATPGANLDIGTVYLEDEPAVTATLYNSVTRAEIPTGTCEPLDYVQCNAIKVCSSATNVCLNQGPTLGSARVQALAPIGYDYIDALSEGFLENTIPIGWINATSQDFSIYMVPMGTVDLSVSVTHNSTSLPSQWHTGMWYSSVCSMNGFYEGTPTYNPSTYTVNMSHSQCGGVCGTIGTQFTPMAGFPLRDDVNVAPDTLGICGTSPQWPIPGDLPVWSNETYVNVTPYATTSSYINLTPGNYVYGNVTVQPGSVVPAGGITALATSQDNPTLQAYGYNSLLSPWMCAPYSQGKFGFCAPVPPGPGKIRISSLTLNYSDNYTWGSTNYMCCYHAVEPMTLNRYTGGPISGIGPASIGQTSINLTQIGSVRGQVFQGNTQIPVFFGSVKISAAGDNPQAPTFDGAVYLNGTFVAQAPLGWVSIQASASGFAPNTVWAYINGTATTYIGNISLTPLATLSGQLINPQGQGIYEADVKYCHVDTPSACTILGAGLSTSNGEFNGTLLGGWLPWTTYEVQVTASGYTQDWAWVNATAGQTTVLPPITLYPVGINQTGAVPHHASLSSSAVGVWVDGTLLDSSHDIGIQTGGIQACPTGGTGTCTLFSDGSNSQGYFNASVTPGLYYLTVTAQGYSPTSVFFNASAASYLHLGAIYMSELPWVSGTANITPYNEITVKDGAKVVQIALSPGATAFACNSNSSVCGTALQLSTQGQFFVQTGGGVYNKVQVTPNGGTVGPSINGGFGSNVSIFNQTGPITNITANLTLAIYALVGGYVWMASSVSPTGQSPWLPSRFTPVEISTFGPNHAANSWTTNGGGFYEFFLPGGPTQVVAISGLSPEATIPANISINLTEPLTNRLPVTVALLPQINLTHFGWLVFRLSNAINGAPAPYVGVSASFNDPLNGTLSSTGVSNAFGFVNMTAPPGGKVHIQIAATQDFNATQFNVSINASETTFVNGTDLSNLGSTGLQPFGWIRSTDLNNTTIPDLPTIVDQVNGLPLPLASIQVASPMPGLSGSSLDSNWMGQFLSDAPPGLADQVVVTKEDYLTNTSTVAVAPNAVVTDPVINLTGVGILAGQVFQYPGEIPIPFATVQTCPINSTGYSDCYSTTANASGVFWVASYPNLVKLTVTADGFVSNSTVIGKSCSDCWDWLPPIVLNEFSYVFGTVRALPSGLPINNATVGACSTLGNPVGLCGFTVQSTANGQFLLAVPSGSYILMANATGFNATYLPIYLVPGEILPVGIMFLKQFGEVVGTVLSSATLLPVSNASVFGCPLWSGGACTPTAFTNFGGQFTISGPPGPYTIAVLANGYADSYSAASLISGLSINLPPILITPLGVDVYYQVSGQVVNASNPSSGIVDAVVSADVNGTIPFSAETGSNGGFTLNVAWGTYVLTVVDPGYLPAHQNLTVHENVYGLLVSLQVMTFTVSGAVSDGLTHQVLSGVTIAESGTVQAVTDVNGEFSFQEANGTHSLVATYQGGGTVAYAPIDFEVVVNGVSVTHDLSLVPQAVTISGSVVDSVAGTPLAGAVVLIHGTTVDGVPQSITLTTNPTGQFSTTLYLGSYNASASYTGYNAATVAFSVTPAGQAVPIPLHPTATTGTTTVAPSGNGAQWILLASLGVVAVALLALAVLVVRRRQPPARPKAAARPPAVAAASRPRLGAPPKQ
jgi:Carboxypeptidase regulatory-like domain